MFALWNRPAPRLIFLTLVAMGAFATSVSRQNQIGPIPALVLDAFSLLQMTAAKTVSLTGEAGSRYVYLVGVQKRLDQLETERGHLLAERAALVELARENTRLRELIGLKEKLGGDLVAARVIGIADEEKATLTIDRGSLSGIQPGQAVLANGGVIGQIWYAGRLTSTVLLLEDPRSRVPVYNARSRARSIVTGGGAGDPLEVNRVRRTDDVQPGDLLISAGSGLIFPRGLPVAMVTAVGNPGVGLTLPVTAVPAASVRHLDEVLVVRARAEAGDETEETPADIQPPAEGNPP
ncbi:MAG: rod shape-determining protein MreC [Deltaproteobacteria bacterium]|nr:rod shape-determining protein MreC [Deltaproteobacteria bacterium]